ncbi:unnamed protein product [Urochloa decumbens]|uniref:F-box domain-containing protein n=1 Tax=Urochloa decumbens TaxID=240449 RepID=A0ABC9HBF3_9POAL
MDHEDILPEILVRLSPRPSSLLGASLVCKRWSRLLADPYFLRRLRAHHRWEIPLLGFFTDEFGFLHFTPLLEPPDRIPSERLSMGTYHDEGWRFHECRHGIALLLNRKLMELAVWDPVTGEKCRLAVPPGFNGPESRVTVRAAALLCDDSKQAFSVVVLRHDEIPKDDKPLVFTSVYESKTGIWGNLISAPITSPLWLGKPSILVGNSLCWWLRGYGDSGILEFDLERQSLVVIDTPVDTHANPYSSFQILRMEDDSLGLAILSDVSIQLWERKANSGGFAKWMLHKTIELDKLLSLLAESTWLVIQGYDEDGNWIFVWTNIGIFMIQLESMQFRNLFKTHFVNNYHPYTNFYTAGSRIGGGSIEAEALNST